MWWSVAASAVVAGIVAHVVAASGHFPCLEGNVLEPSDRCHSLHPTQVKSCLTVLGEDLSPGALENCFMQAGCDELDAKVEAQRVVEICPGQTELRNRPRDGGEKHDKHGKHGKHDKNNKHDNEKSEKKDSHKHKTDNTEKKNKTKGKHTSKTEKHKEATTTSSRSETTASTTSSEGKSTKSDLPESTATSATVAAPKIPISNIPPPLATGGANDLGALKALTCFTTITFTTAGFELVSTASSGRPSRTFNPHMVAVKTRCADGMVCRDKTCLEAKNSLTGSGVAVAIFFAIAAAVALATLIFLCCRDRRGDKRRRATAEAVKAVDDMSKPAVAVATIRAASASKRPLSGSDRQPLIHQSMYPTSPVSPLGRPSHDHFGNQRKL